MPEQDVSFSIVLERFERNGWALKKTWGYYRVFVKPNDADSHPCVIPVHDKKVSREIYLRIIRFFDNEERGAT